jgi:hypothetical protein
MYKDVPVPPEFKTGKSLFADFHAEISGLDATVDSVGSGGNG